MQQPTLPITAPPVGGSPSLPPIRTRNTAVDAAIQIATPLAGAVLGNITSAAVHRLSPKIGGEG
jgi:hypothetical protein